LEFNLYGPALVNDGRSAGVAGNTTRIPVKLGCGAGWVNGWYDPESWKDASKARAESDAEFTYKKLNGNALLIYSPGIIPNVDGPCPSIRLKTMRNVFRNMNICGCCQSQIRKRTGLIH